MADIADVKQSDRAVALVGGAYVDLVLLESITSRLTRSRSGVSSRGHLQAFASRIHLGYALGIFADGVYSDLKKIKDIRNAFAHSVEDLTFGNASVSAIADKFNVRRIRFQGRLQATSSRAQFVHAIEMITDLLRYHSTWDWLVGGEYASDAAQSVTASSCS